MPESMALLEFWLHLHSLVISMLPSPSQDQIILAIPSRNQFHSSPVSISELMNITVSLRCPEYNWIDLGEWDVRIGRQSQLNRFIKHNKEIQYRATSYQHFQTPNSPIMESKITEIAEMSDNRIQELCKRIKSIQKNQTLAQAEEICPRPFTG